ncbi:NAD-dependent epimerase/dehydratase family protein [Sphingopyxis microcysteis]|uniref:NAD-dependent epimerase/dehydratase family protein n=1 Tax=Sphingopyxis microcysteis TaxID=2484145 RepID=UPI001444A42A|nr:NAD-dependent epimerase/dehydratase [Sphingopyxis microcysteis]
MTGATGFVGGRLMRYLQGTGRHVAGWTRADGDLRDGDAVRARIASLRPDHIFHLASRPPGSGDDWSRIMEEQRMLANLAYAMPQHCTLIYTGSMAEYGRSGILRDSDQCTPDTVYGCAKLAGTSLALALRSMLDLDIRVGRLFGVYGPGESPARLLPALIEKLRAGDSVPLSDGRQLRDFIHVDDACKALVALGDASSEAKPPVIMNIGTGTGVTVTDVCTMTADILGADHRLLRFGALPRRPVDQDCLVADVTAMRTIVEPPAQRWLDRASAAPAIEEMIATAAADSLEKSE